MSFCTRCGHPADGTTRFCTKCGAQLRPADSQATPALEDRGATAPAPDRAGTESTAPTPPAFTAPTPAPPGPPVSLAGNFPPDDPGAHPGPWRGRRVPVWLPVAAALVVVLGGLAGWYLTSSHSTRPVASAHPPSPAKPSTAGGSAQAATAQPSTPPPSPTASPASPTVAATATSGTAGSDVVALGPGVSGQPAAGAIAAFLGQYFTAINQHDYQSYISLFTPAAQQNESPQEFSSGYATTSDSSETLVTLSPAHHGKTPASVTFISHQAPADSATHTACTIWRITLFLRPAGTSYLIGKGPASYQPSKRACP